VKRHSRKELVAAKPSQYSQKSFHGRVPPLWFKGLPRRTNRRSTLKTGSSRADGKIYYLVRHPWLGITPSPNKKLPLLPAGRQFEKRCAADRAISLRVEL
jgi:hypothetical protein